jgi:hypothetical protein
VQLALPVEGAARRRVAGRLGEPLARPPRLLQRVRPGAVELHDLGAVHLALAAVGDQLRLRLDPVAQRGGPLPRPAQVEDLLAGLDRGAVGLAGHGRRQLAGGGGDHDLVEQGHARGGLSLQQQRVPPPHPGERPQVGLVEAVADLGRPAEGRARGRGVALEQVLVPDQHQQVPLLGTVALAGACQLAAQHQLGGQPQGAPRRPLRVAPAQQLVVGARAQPSALSWPLPSRYAAVASRSRSSGSSGDRRSAAAKRAYASAQAHRW